MEQKELEGFIKLMEVLRIETNRLYGDAWGVKVEELQTCVKVTITLPKRGGENEAKEG